MTDTLTGPGCEPWPLGPCPIPDNTLPEMVAWASRAAEDMLWAASGRQFGVCRTVEAFGVYRATDCTVPWGPQAAALGPTVLPGLVTGAPLRDRCCALLLRGPAVAVHSVEVDGLGLDPSEYVLTGDRLLTADGGCWPDVDACSPPAIVVDYSLGVPPPAVAAGAMSELYGELLRACTGDPGCRLPSRVVNLARQGVQMVLLDPQDYLDNGRLGLPLCDLFISSVNPGHLIMPSAVVSPDYRPGGIRVVSP
jgi:hypothetical protein